MARSCQGCHDQDSVGGFSLGSYDEVVAFFQKEKEFIVTMNFMKSGALAKVYRFFPKYYTRFQGQWLSTALRIRTTRGDEKKFLNETTARVLKKKGGELEIYADPKKDPRIKGPVNKMFSTN